MPTDPRLENSSLLMLAAFRLQQRRQQQVPDWRYTEGLASLLAASKAMPQRDPWDLPALDERSGLGRLLEEARQWQHGGDDGA
jgi:hypothetical protein